MRTTLAEHWDMAWRLVAQGGVARAVRPRLCVLATQDAQGVPSQRLLVIRAHERSEGWVELHTDSASDKADEIAQCPRVSLLMWDPDAQFQLRMAAQVETFAGTEAHWAKIPAHARTAYGGAPKPGTPLATPETHTPGADRDRHLILKCNFVSLETLQLTQERPFRARFDRHTDWAGTWLAP